MGIAVRKIGGPRLPYLVLAVVLTAAAVVVLLATRSIPLAGQPFPDSAEYADGAYRLAHGDGYSTTVRDISGSPHLAEAVNPPRYPPGYSIALAPFTLVKDFPGNVELGTKVLALVLVLVIAWAALELGGPWAAVIAVLLALLGSFVARSAQVVLSDAFGATLAVALLPLVKRRSPTAVYAAGVVAGYGVVVRNSGVVVLACLLIVLSHRDRVRVLIGAAPPVAGLAIYQWSAFGRPWSTGYSYWLPQVRAFSPGFITKHPPRGDTIFLDAVHPGLVSLSCRVSCARVGMIGSLPSWLFYPMAVIGFFGIFSPPFVSVIGLVSAARSWREPVARLVLLTSIVTVLFFLPYFFQSGRFMAAPAMMLVVYAAVGIAGMVTDLGRRHAFTGPPAPR